MFSGKVRVLVVVGERLSLMISIKVINRNNKLNCIQTRLDAVVRPLVICFQENLESGLSVPHTLPSSVPMLVLVQVTIVSTITISSMNNMSN